jgi:hypothetical protein
MVFEAFAICNIINDTVENDTGVNSSFFLGPPPWRMIKETKRVIKTGASIVAKVIFHLSNYLSKSGFRQM